MNNISSFQLHNFFRKTGLRRDDRAYIPRFGHYRAKHS